MDTVLLNLASVVGTTLRSHREKIGAKQGDIAKKASISTSMLSQIERGESSPSLDTLHRICVALEISVSQVFASVEEKQQVVITKHGDRSVSRSGGASFEEIAHYTTSALSAELFLVSLEVGAHIDFPGNAEIRDGAQMGFVLSGTATLVVEGEEYTISSGDGVSFPAKCAHTIRNRPNTSFTLSRKFTALWFSLPSRRGTAKF